MALSPLQFQSPADAVEALLTRLTKPATLMAAVSGGSDSAGLLIALHQALSGRDDRGSRLVAATVDHGLRPEGIDEARAVASLCAELSIPHKILRWTGEKPASGISAAAREARYRLLMEAADAFAADVIVTGHTYDDQMETIAMRASRSGGDGNLGLAGMAECVLIDGRRWLLRPLLETRREAIRDFLKGQGRGWIDDPSNADRHYERVRVRASLRDRAGVTPDAVLAAGRRRRDLAKKAADLARHHLKVHHGVLARMSLEAFGDDTQTLRHLLGMLAAVLGGRPHLPAASAMDRIMAMLESHRPGRITAGRVIYDLRREALFMHREARDLPVLHVAGNAGASWDGRYRLSNLGESEITVGSTPPDRELAVALFPDAPPAIAMRAMGVMPHVATVFPLQTPGDKAKVIVDPVLAPFDRFLPQFELTLASELAILFGCEAFPVPPIKFSERKS